MATRKQFIKVEVPGVAAITRGSNAVGGTVIGDYIQNGQRVLVVEMPKIEKKVKKVKRGPVSQAVADAAARINPPVNPRPMRSFVDGQEVTNG